MHLFMLQDLILFLFLFLLVSGVGRGLWLWHSLDIFWDANVISYTSVTWSFQAVHGHVRAKKTRKSVVDRMTSHNFWKILIPVRAPLSPWLKVELVQLSDTDFLWFWTHRRLLDSHMGPCKTLWVPYENTFMDLVQALRALTGFHGPCDLKKSHTGPATGRRNLYGPSMGSHNSLALLCIWVFTNLYCICMGPYGICTGPYGSRTCTLRVLRDPYPKPTENYSTPICIWASKLQKDHFVRNFPWAIGAYGSPSPEQPVSLIWARH